MRIRTTAPLVLATVVLGIPVPAQAGPAEGSPPAPVEMVLTATVGGNTDIYLRSPSGELRRLTDHPAHDYGAVWSPDGTRLAFVSDRDGDDEIYVMDADGGSLRQLTRNGTAGGPPVQDQAPAWSPDGRQIVFASTRDGGEPEIYRMRSDGRAQVRLTRTHPAILDHSPSYSPDGRYVVFTSDRVGVENGEIFRMRANGSQVVRLTHTGDHIHETSPEYSPDGSVIAFATNRNGEFNDIWAMDADGSDPRRLAGESGLDDAFPRWQPDGRALVWTATPTVEGTSDIWFAAADGSAARPLTDDRAGEDLADPRPRTP